MIPDEELKSDLASRRPYGKWLEEQRIEMTDLPSIAGKGLNQVTLTPRMQAFGYTQETLQFMLLPMIKELRDPLGSMGNDAALAVMSEKPRMLYDYLAALCSGNQSAHRFHSRRSHYGPRLLHWA